MPRRKRNTLSPVLGNTLEGWRQILTLGNYIDPEYKKRVSRITTMIRLMWPLRAWEHMRLSEQIAKTEIDPSPVFIIGHWRSGTTHLHNLLSQDPQFGYITNLQTIFPHAFMTNPLIRAWAKWKMPATRPMDRMAIGLDTPQEDEMAMMNSGPWSLYHAWSFPMQFQQIYKRMVLLGDQADRDAWSATYLAVLRKATFNHRGKRLILKNPPHTARIPLILQLFPQAHFIHIYRDPYQVFGSMKKLYSKIWPIFQLQDYSNDVLLQAIVFTYREMMHKYLDDRERIPSDQLVEISHRQLRKHPVETLEQVYRILNLGSFEAVKSSVSSYLRELPEYPFEPYELTPAERSLVDREWGFVTETSLAR